MTTPVVGVSDAAHGEAAVRSSDGAAERRRDVSGSAAAAGARPSPRRHRTHGRRPRRCHLSARQVSAAFTTKGFIPRVSKVLPFETQRLFELGANKDLPKLFKSPHAAP